MRRHEAAKSQPRRRSARGWRPFGLWPSAHSAPPGDLIRCSVFVLMEVETLGMARSLGWRVHMRCSGFRESPRSMRRCVYRKQLDLETPVATRGPNFPISRLESRLMSQVAAVGR